MVLLRFGGARSNVTCLMFSWSQVALDLWQLGFIDVNEVPCVVGPGCCGPCGEALSVTQVEHLGGLLVMLGLDL